MASYNLPSLLSEQSSKELDSEIKSPKAQGTKNDHRGNRNAVFQNLKKERVENDIATVPKGICSASRTLHEGSTSNASVSSPTYLGKRIIEIFKDEAAIEKAGDKVDNPYVIFDETALTEDLSAVLKRGLSSGNVEEIVQVLKQQNSHDLLCPVCGSCITRRIIIQKRKGTNSDFSAQRIRQEADPSSSSPDNLQIRETPINSREETLSNDREVYGCLSCFSFFFKKGNQGNNIKGNAVQTATENLACLKKGKFPLEASPEQSNQSNGTFYHVSKFAKDNVGWSKSAKPPEPNDFSRMLNTNYRTYEREEILHDGSKRNPRNEISNLIQSPAKTNAAKDESSRVTIPSLATSWSIWPKRDIIKDKEILKPLLGGRQIESKVHETLALQCNLFSSMKPDTFQLALKLSEMLRKIEDNALRCASGAKTDSIVEQGTSYSKSTANSIQDKDTIVAVEPASLTSSAFTRANAPRVTENLNAQMDSVNNAKQWDILKSVVYGGLPVTISILGVISSAAGSEAETRHVVVMAISTLIAGLLTILNVIRDLGTYHIEHFRATIGHNVCFNGIIAVISYLVFGLIGPVAYGFSYRITDDHINKYLVTSEVSLTAILALSFAKARVSGKAVASTVFFYLVTGIWASVLGFLGGFYGLTLLEQFGLVN